MLFVGTSSKNSEVYCLKVGSSPRSRGRGRDGVVLTVEAGDRGAIGYMIAKHAAVWWERRRRRASEKDGNRRTGGTIIRARLPHQRTWKPLERPASATFDGPHACLCPIQLQRAPSPDFQRLHTPPTSTFFRTSIHRSQPPECKVRTQPRACKQNRLTDSRRQSTRESHVRPTRSRRFLRIHRLLSNDGRRLTSLPGEFLKEFYPTFDDNRPALPALYVSTDKGRTNMEY